MARTTRLTAQPATPQPRNQATPSADPNPQRHQRLVLVDLPRSADVVLGPLGGDVDAVAEAGPEAVVDLGPGPPEARRRELLVRGGAEGVLQSADASGRLDVLHW